MINVFRRSGSFIRLLHGAPGAPAVDVYANDNLIANNLSFKNLSSYIRVRPGKYNIKVYPAGRRRNPVLVENITVRSNTIYTVAVINKENTLGLFQLIDLHEVGWSERSGRDISFIRAVHLSPNAPAVDIRIDNYTIVTNLSYRTVSRYVSIEPGTYNLNVFVSGTNNNVLKKENVVLQSDFYYTMYVLGLVGEEPPLQAIVPIDGIYRITRR